MSDYKLAKKSLKEEKKAVSDYADRRDESKDKDLKKVFTHARNEEKTHAKMFSKAMKKKKQYSESEIKEAQRKRGGE